REHNLRMLELSEAEWDSASELCEILKVFKDATTFFSRTTPNLATIIPAIDHIDEILTSHESDESLNGSVRAALSLGKKTLDRYYSLTDSSEVYRIAMVLHPRHKLSYFQTAGWTADWIQTA
ncbi:hypothetical protein DFH29DRAFT_787158, partial [Suillus ampliporus]